MAHSSQLKLISGIWKKDRFAFGGALLKNSHAKTKRPFVPKLPLHLVLKSSKARGKLSFLSHNSRITRAIEQKSQRHGVTILTMPPSVMPAATGGIAITACMSLK